MWESPSDRKAVAGMSDKTWMEHSPSWRAKASAEGATRQRWDAWSKLSPAARKATSQRDYATGLTFTESKRKHLQRVVFLKMKKLAPKYIKDASIEKRIKESFSDADLKWTADASLDEIRKRSKVQKHDKRFPDYMDANERNIWWYR